MTATDTPMVRYTRTIFPSYASEEIKVYESARAKQLDSYKEVLENEILAMNKMGQ